MKSLAKLSPLALAASLAGGCSTPITATDAGKVASAIGHIEPSRKDTCETQKQIAAQSSRIDTIIKGSETVYKAPDCAPKPGPASQPATS